MDIPGGPSVITRVLKSRRVRRGWCEVTGEGPRQLLALEGGGRRPGAQGRGASGGGKGPGSTSPWSPEEPALWPRLVQRLSLDSDSWDCQWQPRVALSHCICSDLMHQYWSDTVLCPVEETPFYYCS